MRVSTWVREGRERGGGGGSVGEGGREGGVSEG